MPAKTTSVCFMLLASVFSGSVAAVAEPQTTAGATDLAGLAQQLASLTNLLGLTGSVALPTGTFANPLDGLSLPTAPGSVLQEIMTAVPSSVYSALLDASGRASIASEFSAGHTPAWYSSLPADAKSYIEAAQSAGATLSVLTTGKVTLGSYTISQGPKKTTGTLTGSASEATSTKESAASALHVSYSTALVLIALSAVALM